MYRHRQYMSKIVNQGQQKTFYIENDLAKINKTLTSNSGYLYVYTYIFIYLYLYSIMDKQKYCEKNFQER